MTKYHLNSHHSVRLKLFVFICLLTLLEKHDSWAFGGGKPAIVDCNSNNTRDYSTLHDAIDNKEQYIIIRPCLYLMNSILKITYSNVLIQGDDTSRYNSSNNMIILRQTVQDDGIWIGNGASNITMSGLILDGQTHNSRSMFTVGGGRNITLENCIIFGPKDMFSVYFAGPDNLAAGNDTLMAFESGNMDCFNRIIFSNWDGDVLSFSMQRYGVVENNKVVGGKIAFYMNRDSFYVNNTIVNSTSGGIEISLPGRDLFIAFNRILSPRGSGIKTVNEVEHPLLNPPLERNGNITLYRNVIKDGRFFGISIENVKDSIISHNSIYNTDLISIWTMRSDRLHIHNNLIVNWGLEKIRGNLYQFNTHQCGIFMELSNKDHIVEKNTLYAGSACEKYGILSQNIFGRSILEEQSNLLVQLNTLVGKVTAEWVELKGNSGISLNNTKHLNMVIQDDNEPIIIVENNQPPVPSPSPSIIPPTQSPSVNPPSPITSPNHTHLVFSE